MNKNTLTFKVLGVLGIFLSCALVTMGVVTMWLQYRSTMDLQTKNASNVTAIIIKDIQDYMMKGMPGKSAGMLPRRKRTGSSVI